MNVSGKQREMQSTRSKVKSFDDIFNFNPIFTSPTHKQLHEVTHTAAELVQNKILPEHFFHFKTDHGSKVMTETSGRSDCGPLSSAVL